MKYLIKITCYTPKGKAESSSKSFSMQRIGGMFKSPIKTEVESDSIFRMTFSYNSMAERDNIILKKIPMAELAIRESYKQLMNRFRKAKDMEEMKEFLKGNLFSWEVWEE